MRNVWSGGYLRVCLALIALWTVCAVLGTAAFWTTLAIGTTQMRGDTSLPSLFRLQGLPWLATALLTPLLVAWAAVLSPARTRRAITITGHAAGLIVFGLAQTTLIISLQLLASGRAYDFSVASFFGRTAGSAVLILTTYACIVGATEAWNALERASAARRAAEELVLSRTALERDLVSARLMLLRQQLQPHFLFNALNSVAGLIEEDPSRARRLLARVGDLLRLALDRSQSATATLGEELDFADRFLHIEQERLGGRLQVTYEIGDETLGVRVPSFAVQPLVENAIRHGIARIEQGGRVTIGASRRGSALRVSITNDVGTDVSTASESGGLGNLRARLAGIYGAAATLDITCGEGRFHAAMTVPVESA